MQFPAIQQNTDLQQAVSARELYNFLTPTERFASWFDRQLQYGFISGLDYLGCEVFNTLANQTLTDFFVSIDMAKEISMIQRSDKGRQARQYFIECERKAINASSPVMPALPHDYISALEELLITKKGEQAALEQVKELQPKADALDTLSHAKGALGIRETAITVGIPERKFIARCTDENKAVSSRFMYRDEKNKLRAYSHRIKQGFMTQKITSYAGKNGQDLVTVQVKFTAAGVAHIAKMMQNKPAKQLRAM